MTTPYYARPETIRQAIKATKQRIWDLTQKGSMQELKPYMERPNKEKMIEHEKKIIDTLQKVLEQV